MRKRFQIEHMKNTTASTVTEKIINAYLASIPADKRPETSFRQRIASVVAVSRNCFDATTTSGQVETIPANIVLGWLK